MAKKTVHTVPNNKNWQNKVDGVVVSNHKTKANAEKAGRLKAKQLETEHVVHNRDGRIGEKNSYGNDPNPPKDKK